MSVRFVYLNCGVCEPVGVSFRSTIQCEDEYANKTHTNQLDHL